MEFLFEIICEVLLQILSEAVVELGFYSLEDTFRTTRNPALSGIGFALWGVFAGAASLWPFPHNFIAGHALRLVNVVIAPLMGGGAMVLIGRIRLRHGQSVIRMDRFSYAFVFSLGMALMRFVFAK